jgi:hypothetical protein
MSRTRHHKNQKHYHNGHDLWSRRPCSSMCYSAFTKRLTRRIERKRKLKEIKFEMQLSEIN